MASNKLYLERDLLKSKAFRSLARTSMLVYFDFRMKCRVQQSKGKLGRGHSWHIVNNGQIEYTYGEAEKKGISRPSFMRGLTELTEKGFIDITHSGSDGVKGDKSKYVISERWRDWGTDRFVEKTRPKDTRRGRSLHSIGKRKEQTSVSKTIIQPLSKMIIHNLSWKEWNITNDNPSKNGHFSRSWIH
jgi:DNA-binding PadR family transcriptional regulator